MNRAATALLASIALCASSGCLASDVDPSAETAPVAPASTKNFFGSWFGNRAAKIEADAPPLVEREVVASDTRTTPPGAAQRASDLVVGALGLLGIHYRRGGNSPESGFDCSGMVRYVFQNTMGLDLPRRAVEISLLGAKVDRSELKPGDLVFYNTLKKTFSHVGIYLGNNRFIHAPASGGAVRVEDMGQAYWAARFSGARRLATS